jgi:hypothetical protein
MRQWKVWCALWRSIWPAGADSPYGVSLIDRRTIAFQWKKNGEVTEWNSIFAYATLEMGVVAELCWPYCAQQKGSVENLVGFVKSSFFKVRRLHDEEDLRQQLQAWHWERRNRWTKERIHGADREKRA